MLITKATRKLFIISLYAWIFPVKVKMSCLAAWFTELNWSRQTTCHQRSFSKVIFSWCNLMLNLVIITQGCKIIHRQSFCKFSPVRKYNDFSNRQLFKFYHRRRSHSLSLIAASFRAIKYRTSYRGPWTRSIKGGTYTRFLYWVTPVFQILVAPATKESQFQGITWTNQRTVPFVGRMLCDEQSWALFGRAD